MTKGFQSADETKIEIAIKRLIPSAKRADIHAFADGVRETQTRYGHDIADEAMRQIFTQFPELAERAIEFLPESAKPHLLDCAYSLMAQAIEVSGLRIEDHFRVCDHGVAMTHDAISVIASTGFPPVAEFGQGNDSLTGVGIDRTGGFIHPLSEVHQKEYLNSFFVVSMTISATLNWLDEPPDNPETPRSFLRDCVSRVAPTLDLETMLFRVRYDDRALMQLASYAERGFTAIAQKAVDDKR